MKNIIILITTILIALPFTGCNKTINNEKLCINANTFKDRIHEAKQYCKHEGINQKFCILIDMSIHSGKDRMFVYSFEKGEIIDSALCSHGCGNAPWGGDETKTDPIFSNVADSHSSSLGKYLIKNRGGSSFGIGVNYRLHGLETTNSNANKRDIVLHSWKHVSDTPVYPNGTPEGWGCPAVSNDMMRILDKKLQSTSKPVLLWIFN
jgi:hypothetical protein|tara:strand:- start:585 stop:1205 length:621 start_codon:yes stop_codon:yes gene_type:complete